jgi:SAM-dependent methyltransferase
MDELHRINRERWNALARANVAYTQPFLEYTREQAEAYVFRHNILRDVSGKRVLCLASGGGQASVAFGLLGAEVTVLDISDVQLERDRQGAAHHGFAVTTLQGDMRDLSAFANAAFEVVWQDYSINFVPSVQPVFAEVARVLKPGGFYQLAFANPSIQTVDEASWDGKGYSLSGKYIDGEDITERFPHWDVDGSDGTKIKMDSPHEFRHTLATILNTLVGHGFILLGFWEVIDLEGDPEPGSWEYFLQVAPLYFASMWAYHPKGTT